MYVYVYFQIYIYIHVQIYLWYISYSSYNIIVIPIESYRCTNLWISAHFSSQLFKLDGASHLPKSWAFSSPGFTWLQRDGEFCLEGTSHWSQGAMRLEGKHIDRPRLLISSFLAVLFFLEEGNGQKMMGRTAIRQLFWGGFGPISSGLI